MSWVRLDDQFSDHPKIAKAGAPAAWLYVCGLTYASRFLTDGFIPRGQVARLADVREPLKLAERLVAARLWEPAEDGFRIHDYLDYNASAEEVRATRGLRSEAGRRGGRRSGEARRAYIDEANGEATAKQFASSALRSGFKQTRSKREAKSNPMPMPIATTNDHPLSSSSAALSDRWKTRACAALGRDVLTSWETRGLAAREAEGFTVAQLDWALDRAADGAESRKALISYAMAAIVDAPEARNGQQGAQRHERARRTAVDARNGQEVRPDRDLAESERIEREWAKYTTPDSELRALGILPPLPGAGVGEPGAPEPGIPDRPDPPS